MTLDRLTNSGLIFFFYAILSKKKKKNHKNNVPCIRPFKPKKRSLKDTDRLFETVMSDLLVADTRLYKPLFSPSVGPSVLRSFGPSVLRSFGPSVLRSFDLSVRRSITKPLFRVFRSCPLIRDQGCCVYSLVTITPQGDRQ